jgi:endonuclease-3
VRTAAIIKALRKAFPDARIELDFRNPLELLVATILSAQCTDKRVNMVTPRLFEKYPTAADYAQADPGVFEKEIQSTGFFRNKTKSVLGAAARIVRSFNGTVPANMKDLLTLPGVARKTANVVLGGAFGKCEGIVVDTHVARLAQRLKLTRHKDNAGDRIENDLMRVVPEEAWWDFGNLLIWQGRRVCSARRPKCAGCAIGRLCPSAFRIS